MKDMFYLLKWKGDLNIEDIIVTLKNKNYLPSAIRCPSCSSDMVIHKDSSRKDHFRWVCKRCRKRKPIRVNTWAAKYRIPFTELFVLVRYYVENAKISSVSKRLKLEASIVEKFFSDLDQLIPLYIKKLGDILTTGGANFALKERFERCKDDFKTVSKIFSLSVIFNVVLDTLQETYSS